MAAQPNSEDDWTRLYHWFHGNTEILRDQVDRLENDVKGISPRIAECHAALAEAKRAGHTLSEEAKRASAAWNNADEAAKKIAIEAAKTASASATQAVTDSVGQLNGARHSLEGTKASLNKAVDRIWVRVHIYMGVSFLIAALSAYGGFYFSRSMEAPLEERMALLISRGLVLENMYRIATPNEEKILNRLFEKAQTFETKASLNVS